MKKIGNRPRIVSLASLAVSTAVVFSFTGTTPAAAATCESLASYHRPHTTITAAENVPAGSYTTPTSQTITDLPAFCRVAGYVTPTADSHISFEVWIPKAIWNRKYIQVGCGGFCGSISYSAMAEPLRRGYASAATDDGHQAGGFDASWAVGHPEKVIDYGYRAVKETTDVAKDIIAQFKSPSLSRSYFMGCSDGGREGLMSAQRYPNDFDGIIAGSPGNNWTGMMAGFLSNELALLSVAGGDLTQTDLNILSNAVLAQCVGRDGGLNTDKFLNHPPACKFNVTLLTCNASNAGACLPADKVKAVKKIFSGPAGIFPGYQWGAGEASAASNWPAWLTDSGNPANGVQGTLANSFFQNMVFPNSGWTPDSHTITQNANRAYSKLSSIVNSIDPDLTAFKAHGGKLIQYVGWSDTGISPQNDIDYYTAATYAMGGVAPTQKFYRLFMVPGMSHCSGGLGATAFGQSVNGPTPTKPGSDIISALDRWVEHGTAPKQIVATKYVNDDPNQGVAFQRPLCPYPKFARYNGSGTLTHAGSFACVSR
jgi:feruloyl esterase